jgi:hypothetical protein
MSGTGSDSLLDSIRNRFGPGDIPESRLPAGGKFYILKPAENPIIKFLRSGRDLTEVVYVIGQKNGKAFIQFPGRRGDRAFTVKWLNEEFLGRVVREATPAEIVRIDLQELETVRNDFLDKYVKRYQHASRQEAIDAFLW